MGLNFPRGLPFLSRSICNGSSEKFKFTPRFLLLSSFADSIPQFRGELIKEVRRAGYELHVAAPALLQNAHAMAFLNDCGCLAHDVPLQRSGTNPIADVRLLLAYWTLMRQVSPDAVLGYTIKPVVYGSIAAWLAGVPRRFAMVTGLGYAFTGERAGLVVRLVRVLYAFALRRVHKVFFQNPDDEAMFRTQGLLSKFSSSVVVNGSGIDVGMYVPAALPEGPVCFVMIGRLLGDKGVREYAAAAQRVKALHPEVRFRLVGWIDSNPDAIAQEELDAWVDSDTIEFLGRIDDVRSAIAGCTVYVLPSYREGTPRTVLEAMAMSRAIITTDAPGCRETTIDGVNGFLVPVQSVEDLSWAMLRFIDESELAATMGRRSREIAEEKYDVRKVNAVMLREMDI